MGKKQLKWVSSVFSSLAFHISNHLQKLSKKSSEKKSEVKLFYKMFSFCLRNLHKQKPNNFMLNKSIKLTTEKHRLLKWLKQ